MQALDLGIHPRMLYRLRDEGILDCISRGVFRLSELPPLTNPDLVTVALRIPKAAGALCSGGARVPPVVLTLGSVLSECPWASETPPDTEKAVHTREPMVSPVRVGHSRGRLHLPHLRRCPL